MLPSLKAETIVTRELNDNFRRTFVGGQVLLSSSVAALPDNIKAQVLCAVRAFADFNADNDPHEEHDICFVEVAGEKYIAKIDYYDIDMRYGADAPSDPQRTKRVMTIMSAAEY